MDAIAAFLDGPRAQDAFLLRSVMDPPWSLRIQDRAPVTVVATIAGAAWVTFDDGAGTVLGPGDLAVIRGPDPYVVSDDPATAPRIVIHPGQVCTSPAGEPMGDALALGVRTWGYHGDGATVLLTGTYQTDVQVSRRLLESLPRLIVVRADDWDTPLIDVLAHEVAKDEAGQQVVLDRLLDLLLVSGLRHWCANAGDQQPPWYAAQADPVVGPAVRLLQDRPADDWTVARLAAQVGVSRAALARRFHDLVGVPPMRYLSEWRLALAADLLLRDGATVGTVAHEVGYASPFTFSTAFKRVHGISPRDHRSRAA